MISFKALKYSFVLVCLFNIGFYSNISGHQNVEFFDSEDYEDVEYLDELYGCSLVEVRNYLQYTINQGFQLNIIDRICRSYMTAESFKKLVHKAFEEPLNGYQAKQLIRVIDDIIILFEQLKKQMQIPKDVQIKLSDNSMMQDIYCVQANAKAYFNHEEKAVYILPRFLYQSPSFQLFGLIHELVHYQQNIKFGIDYCIDSEENQILNERDADTQALHAIKCPMCIQIIGYQRSNQESLKKEGYLMRSEILAVGATKSLNDLCDVHMKYIDMNVLAKQKKLTRSACAREYDFALGKLPARLSKVLFD